MRKKCAGQRQCSLTEANIDVWANADIGAVNVGYRTSPTFFKSPDREHKGSTIVKRKPAQALQDNSVLNDRPFADAYNSAVNSRWLPIPKSESVWYELVDDGDLFRAFDVDGRRAVRRPGGKRTMQRQENTGSQRMINNHAESAGKSHLDSALPQLAAKRKEESLNVDIYVKVLTDQII